MDSTSEIVFVHFKPNDFFQKYIKKNSVFKSKKTLQYQQKLTPTDFVYLTYNLVCIPDNIFGDGIISPNSRVQINVSKKK